MSTISRPRILAVLSSDSHGWYLPEFAHPYEVLSPHCDIVVTSPLGGRTVLDPMSVKLFADDEYCIEFATTKNKLWLETEILSSFLGKADEFSAILVVGGFGPMFDLVDNEVSIKLIQEFYQKNLIVSAVCHGAAALINVNTPEGTRLVAGERVTGFSDQEEIDVDMVKHMPFRLQDALDKSSGGHYEKAEKAWAPHVVVSTTKKLLIGQNPASAKPLAEALLGKLLAVAKD